VSKNRAYCFYCFLCCMNGNKRADNSLPGSIRADGDTAFGYLSSFEFIFILCIMRENLEITDDLNQALQRKTHVIVNVIRLISSTKVHLQDLKSAPSRSEI
jgi:hypothetical protein